MVRYKVEITNHDDADSVSTESYNADDVTDLETALNSAYDGVDYDYVIVEAIEIPKQLQGLGF